MKKDFKQFPGTEDSDKSAARCARYTIVIAFLLLLGWWLMPTQ